MRLYITVILTLLAFSSFSQKKKQAAKAHQVGDTLAHSLLWEITGPGLGKPSYLFGTMHILCAQDARISDSLQFAIDQSALTYFEVDMDNMAETLGLFKYIRMQDGKKLSDLLTPAEYQRVKDYFEKNRTILPLGMMERFKPYFITAMLTESKMPCETKNGMEEMIMRSVKKQQKQIYGLESIAFQASVFDSIPYEKQAKDLLQAIDSAGKEDLTTRKMLELYRTQDMQGIDQLTLTEEGGVAEYLELFLYRRNANWIPIMDSAMKKGPVLFAVGAAHLPGKKGVIRLLQHSGYRLRPMRHAVYEAKL